VGTDFISSERDKISIICFRHEFECPVVEGSTLIQVLPSRLLTKQQWPISCAANLHGAGAAAIAWSRAGTENHCATDSDKRMGDNACV
jgi:hypothetical protein